MKTNVIYCDDNLDRLREFPDESVDLIYLDPPFFSNKYYEVVWGDEAEKRSYDDRWKGGIDQYITWMAVRIDEMHRILKNTGSIYLHCDWHASHHLKVSVMDKIFGPQNFQNEIIWHYRKWSTGKRAFQRNHDTIFLYAKSQSKKRTFNQLFMERAESTLKRFGKAKIISGHNEKGKRVPAQTADTESQGVRQDDVWEISRVAPVKQLFPTQKPERLLERILLASSNKGDVVLDPFCGCGTTLVVASRLKRKWVGIDISPTACRVVKERLNKDGSYDFTLDNMPITLEELQTMEPFEFQNYVVRELLGGQLSKTKTADMGIDGYSYLERNPVQVKQTTVGRKVVDEFETAIDRTKKKKGIVVGMRFTKGAYGEAARCKREKGIEIELVTVKELLEKRKRR